MTPFITIILDRPRRLRLTMGAIIEFEQTSGKNLSDSYMNPDGETILYLLWAMLRHEEPELTPDKTAQLARGFSREYLLVPIYKAIHAAFETKNPPPKSGAEQTEAKPFDFTAEFEIAIEMGILPKDFWGLTFSEFAALYDVYIKKRIRHKNDMNYLAWHTALWNRIEAKSFPKLASVLEDETPKPKRERSPEEMLAEMRLSIAAMGGKVVEV